MTRRVLLSSVLAGVAGLLAFEWYLRIASPQVPYMDSLRYMDQLNGILHGQLSWWDIWHGGEHRGLFFPIVHLLEWLGWALDTRVTTRVTGIVVLFTLALWYYQWAKSLSGSVEGRGRAPLPWVIYLVPSLAALVAFSPSGWELWLLDLGLAQLLKNLCIVGFLALWAREIDLDAGARRRPWLGLIGALLVLVVTYGWSYSLTFAAILALATGQAWSPRRVRYRLALLAPILLAQAAYVLGGGGVLMRGSSILDAGGLWAMFRGTLLGAGSVIVSYQTAVGAGLGHAGVLVMLMGAVALTAFVIEVVRMSADGFDATRRFHFSVAAFGIGTLGAAAFSRSGSAMEAAAASRYFVDYQWLVLGTLGLACDSRRLGAPLVSSPRWLALSARIATLSRGMLPAFVIAIGIGQFATWNYEMRVAPLRAEMFQKMRDVYLAGVRTDQDAQLLQASVSEAKRGVQIAQRYELGPFRALRAACDFRQAKLEGSWFGADSRGERWMGQQGSVFLNGCDGLVTIDVFLPPGFPDRVMTVSSNGTRADFVVKPGNVVSLDVPVLPNQRPLRLDLRVDGVTIPRAAGIGVDDRPLGIVVVRIRTSSAG